MYKCLRLGQLGKCPPLRGKLLARPTPVFLSPCFKFFSKCSKVVLFFCLLVKKSVSKCSKVVLTRVHRSPPARSPPQLLHQLSGGKSCPGEKSVNKDVRGGVIITHCQRYDNRPKDVLHKVSQVLGMVASLILVRPEHWHQNLYKVRTCCRWRRQWWGKLEHRAVDTIARELCSPPTSERKHDWWSIFKMLFGKEFTDRAKSDLSPDQGACFAELWQQRHTRRTPSTWRWVRCKAVKRIWDKPWSKEVNEDASPTVAEIKAKSPICSICNFNSSVLKVSCVTQQILSG